MITTIINVAVTYISIHVIFIFQCQFSLVSPTFCGKKFFFLWFGSWSGLCHYLRRKSLKYKEIQSIKNEDDVFVFSKIKTMQLQERNSRWVWGQIGIKLRIQHNMYQKLVECM